MAVVYELLLARGAERWPAEMEELLSPAVAVRQGLVLVPLTTDLKRRLGGGVGRVSGFDKLTPGVAAAAERASDYGLVAYVQQEMHGGDGFEAAVVWDAGRVVFGPVFTATADDECLTDDYAVVSVAAGTAINQALRYVHVERGDHADEYAAVGLDHGRSNEDWLNRLPETGTADA